MQCDLGSSADEGSVGVSDSRAAKIKKARKAHVKETTTPKKDKKEGSECKGKGKSARKSLKGIDKEKHSTRALMLQVTERLRQLSLGHFTKSQDAIPKYRRQLEQRLKEDWLM